MNDRVARPRPRSLGRGAVGTHGDRLDGRRVGRGRMRRLGRGDLGQVRRLFYFCWGREGWHLGLFCGGPAFRAVRLLGGRRPVTGEKLQRTSRGSWYDMASYGSYGIPKLRIEFRWQRSQVPWSSGVRQCSAGSQCVSGL